MVTFYWAVSCPPVAQTPPAFRRSDQYPTVDHDRKAVRKVLTVTSGLNRSSKRCSENVRSHPARHRSTRQWLSSHLKLIGEPDRCRSFLSIFHRGKSRKRAAKPLAFVVQLVLVAHAHPEVRRDAEHALDAQRNLGGDLAAALK